MTEVPSKDVTIDNSAVERYRSEEINVIGIVGGAVDGTDNEAVVCNNYGDALSEFGESNDYNFMVDMIKVAFEEGSDVVIAVQAGTAASGSPLTVSNLETSLAVLEDYSEIDYILCDYAGCDDADAIAKVKAHVDSMFTAEKFRQAFVGMSNGTSAADYVTQANTSNDKNVVLVACSPKYGDSDVHGNYAAAAVCGRVASRKRPPLSFNYEVLSSLSGITSGENFTNAEQETLLTDGATPVIIRNAEIQIVRTVTTYTEDASAIADDTYHDLSAALIEKYIAKYLLDILDTYYKQQINTAETRRSIENKFDSELSQMTFLESYNDTICNQASDDATKVEIMVGYKPVSLLHHYEIVLQRIIS